MWPFKKSEPTTRNVSVGKAQLLVRINDGREYKLELTGRYLGPNPFSHEDWIQDAEYEFYSWQERSRRLGMIHVGDGLHVPLCNVKDIHVSYEPWDVEVTE